MEPRSLGLTVRVISLQERRPAKVFERAPLRDPGQTSRRRAKASPPRRDGAWSLHQWLVRHHYGTTRSLCDCFLAGSKSPTRQSQRYGDGA